MNEKVFKKWNSDTDILNVKEDNLLPESHPEVAKHSPWAYSLNTAKGFYFMHTDNISRNDVDKMQDGRNVVFNYVTQVKNLYFSDEKTTSILFYDVTVWAHNFFRDFMIVTLHETGQTVLIDSRGELFELPIRDIQRYHVSSIRQDKRNGYYVIEHVVTVRYKTE